MKSLNRKLQILGLLALFIVCSSFMHPIKLTASLIEYDEKTNKLRMECKVFIDDFEKSINKTLAKNINVLNLTKKDKAGIDNYFDQYYTINLNGKKLPLKYQASEVNIQFNVLTIKFSESVIKLKKGDKLYIENKLFFQEFGYLQSNRITIRISPFIAEDNNVAVLNDYLILKTL